MIIAVRRARAICAVLLGFVMFTGFIAVPAHADVLPIITGNERFHPVYARNGMVASQEALASEIGVSILKQGGNAVDAAVATGFALAVTLPRAGNLGGGGFMLVHLAGTGETIAIDYRETAPAAATRDCQKRNLPAHHKILGSNSAAAEQLLLS